MDATSSTASVARAGRRFFLTMAVLTVALLVLGCARWYLTLHVFDPQVRQGVQFARAVTDAHEAMLDQETGLRGYQASGSEVYLRPYLDGQRAWTAAAARSWQLLPDRRQADALLTLQDRAAAWQTRHAAPSVARSSSAPVAPTAAELALGKLLFDSYRETYAQVLGAARSHNDALLRQRERVDAVFSGLEIALAAGALLLAARRRRRLVDDLVRPVAEVTQVLSRLTLGEAGARPARYPTREFEALATGVQKLAEAAQRRGEETAAERSAAVARTHVYQRVVAVAHELGGYLDPAEVGHALLRGLSQVADVDVALLREAEDGRLVGVLAALPEGAELPVDGVAEDALRFLRLSVSDDRLVCALPVVHGGTVHALLHLRVHRVVDEDVELALHNLALAAGGALTAARLHEQVHAESRSDALTGLHNRRRFEEDLQHELGLAGRMGVPVSLLLLDVDHFKQYNDQHGHRDGDRLLHDLSSLLTLTLRATDSAYRYGGEELAVLLRGTPADDAVMLAERLRATIAGRLPVTVSVGVITTFARLRAGRAGRGRRRRALRGEAVRAQRRAPGPRRGGRPGAGPPGVTRSRQCRGPLRRSPSS